VRICMIVSNDMTRDSRVDRHAKALGARGHQVTVLSRASWNGQIRFEDRVGYNIMRYWEPFARPRAIFKKGLSRTQALSSPRRSGVLSTLLKMTRIAAIIIVVRLWLYTLAFRMRADVYHCNDLDTLDIGAVMKIAGKKLVYDSHELYVEEVASPSIRRFYLPFEKLLVRLADMIITVNPFIARELQERYGLKKSVHVVLNCPETVPDLTSKRRSKSRSNRTTILYHGGLSPDRGLENLVRASSSFRKGIELILRGDGELESRLKELAAGTPNVLFEKSLPMNAVVKAASRADIGVIAYLPTTLNYFYCSPNKLFEYIQAGLALVTSDLPFLRQVVLGNDLGEVFDPKDPGDIAKKINIVSQRDNLSRFRSNVRRIADQYTWENEKQQLYASYDQLGKSRW